MKKAILRSFDSVNYLAAVELAGSRRQWLAGVPVARNIPSAEMVAGRYLAVAFLDESNPSDAVVVAVYT
jgi:hypothetical protein